MSSRCLRLSSFTASSSPAGLHHPGPAGREGWGCKRLHGQLAEGRGSGRPASLSARSLAQCWPAGSILGMSGISADFRARQLTPWLTDGADGGSPPGVTVQTLCAEPWY